MLLSTRILRVLEHGPRAKRVLAGIAAAHDKAEEFPWVWHWLLESGAIRKFGGRKDAVYGLPRRGR